MNREQIMQRAECAAAHAEGKIVQHKYQENTHWVDYIGQIDVGAWFSEDYEWRIKPEPLEALVWVPDSWKHGMTARPAHLSHDELPGMAYPGRWVRMREIER